MPEPLRQVYLIDGSSYIYRAYYAIRRLSNTRGFATNAVLGFTNMLLKVVRDEDPDGVVVVFDAKGPTFRKDLYPAYKANREAMPEDLVPQFPLLVVEGVALCRQLAAKIVELVTLIPELVKLLLCALLLLSLELTLLLHA